MANGNNLVNLNAEHLSEDAQTLLDYFAESAEGNFALLVGEVVLNIEAEKRKGNTDLVEKLEEIKVWIISAGLERILGE